MLDREVPAAVTAMGAAYRGTSPSEACHST